MESNDTGEKVYVIDSKGRLDEAGCLGQNTGG